MLEIIILPKNFKNLKINTLVMAVNLIIVIVLALVFGSLFFLADYFEHKFIRLHASFIAGISVTYFFLIVLPEISERLPEFPFHLEFFEYLFVLIGFVFIHLSEKLILQKVESGTQKKMRKLLVKEQTLEAVEHNMERILTRELNHDKLDEAALKDIAQALTALNDQEEEMKSEINRYKTKIQDHINTDLHQFRLITDYIYHFLVGIILLGLLSIDTLSGILFFFYAFFRAFVSRRSERHIIFTDLDIYEEAEHDHKLILKIFLPTATFTGILIGLIMNSFIPINLEILFIFYSFISGVILYVIVREVIPEKEKGDPIKFIVGLVGFTVMIIIINIFTNVL
jgi:zinc transporter ZupT